VSGDLPLFMLLGEHTPHQAHNRRTSLIEDH
jgi:hypothetical protein